MQVADLSGTSRCPPSCTPLNGSALCPLALNHTQVADLSGSPHPILLPTKPGDPPVIGPAPRPDKFAANPGAPIYAQPPKHPVYVVQVSASDPLGLLMDQPTGLGTMGNGALFPTWESARKRAAQLLRRSAIDAAPSKETC